MVFCVCKFKWIHLWREERNKETNIYQKEKALYFAVSLIQHICNVHKNASKENWSTGLTKDFSNRGVSKVMKLILLHYCKLSQEEFREFKTIMQTQTQLHNFQEFF